MLIKKEIKYGYSTGTKETTRKRRLVKPSNLTEIRLTPVNSKFLFYGTRHDILKWMSLHSDLVVVYDPISKDDDELALSPPSSPLSSNYLDIPELLTSPISITSPTSPLSSSFPPSPTSPSSPSSLASSLSSDSILSTSEKSRDIVFDLFTIPVKTSEILSDEATFNRPLNIALKCIPWIEVMLEIRLADERKDSKLHPIHRVILPSGSSLSEISKALEKSWKSLIPDSTAFGPDCFIRNSELIYPQNKSKSDSHDVKPKSINSDEESHKSNGFMAGIAKRVPTVDFWLRQKQTSGAIPPGVLTPYIIDDVLEDLNEGKKRDNEKILEEKKEEAELDKELPKLDLPQYENVCFDVLLEKGK
ncbi:hypothetical protein RclHR1_00350019 [Rhizophagus clarus]|uniref:Uncharacterized protein n=1 Tax=Rhizophagus clarus TaxID=94130 RepID=A0A2Z6RB57_9GLOM|nr:hypothetical protein RclHR1_00350019 [Rhizophagus clarus]GES88447.1 hypothetical protein GLOIN_2v1618274 [Rhizophagus clarus]